MYFSECLCSIRAYRNWHNALYKAGYAEALVQASNQRLSTLEELAAAFRFSWESVFGTSSHGKVTIGKAMALVSLNRLVTMELLPKPILPSHFALPLLRNVRQKLQNRTKKRLLKQL